MEDNALLAHAMISPEKRRRVRFPLDAKGNFGDLAGLVALVAYRENNPLGQPGSWPSGLTSCP
jgi:hypothetical protein